MPSSRVPAAWRRSRRSCRALPTECTRRTPSTPPNGSSSGQLRAQIVTDAPASRRGRSMLETRPSRDGGRVPSGRARARSAGPAASSSSARTRRGPNGLASFQRSHRTGTGPSVFRWRTSMRPRKRCTSASITRTPCASAVRRARSELPERCAMTNGRRGIDGVASSLRATSIEGTWLQADRQGECDEHDERPDDGVDDEVVRGADRGERHRQRHRDGEDANGHPRSWPGRGRWRRAGSSRRAGSASLRTGSSATAAGAPGSRASTA